MSDKIFDLIKENVMEAISKEVSIPDDKKQQTAAVTTEALANGLKDNLSMGNLPALTSLFNGESTSESNVIVNSIENTVVNALVDKVGLSRSLSGTIASTVIPLVIKAFSGKINNPQEKGFDVESLIKTFSGGSNGMSGILGSLGKLFS